MKRILLFLAIPFTLSAFAQSPKYQADTFEVIYNYLAEVDTALVLDNIIHLQEYGTRDCFSPQAVEAQNWIKQQFQSYGLEVELQPFQIWGQSSSANVIATLPGSANPDEYVIVGGHYDSFTYSPEAPGADDNASGTCGVLEAARILSQYSFSRTIIFCAFSGEEYGLYGSDAYVARCDQQGMDILGYFNLDMIGYQEPGDELHTDLIAPPSADELAEFYVDVTAIYLPGFPVYEGSLSGGDSDHTSFNDYGYMGIFPFEDDDYYSPYIHTPEDVAGLSVNNMELAGNLIKAAMASVATLAIPFSALGTHEPFPAGPELTIYPNPASDRVFIRTDHQGPASLEVMNLQGRVVASGQFTNSMMISTSQLSPGAYFVKVTGENYVIREKLVIR